MAALDLADLLQALWKRLGATQAPDASTILTAWNEPQRVYHGIEHLRDCLDQFATVRTLAEHPDEVEAALWFHDLVYDPRRGDNEECSAVCARTMLGAAGVPLDVAERVAALVLATRHQSVPVGVDAQVLVDVDLSILGREPAAFDEYERKIGREYGWVPEADFRQGRARVLRHFLDRDAIFSTLPLRERYEKQARANLQRSLAKLEAVGRPTGP